MRVIGGSARQHADDLTAGALLGRVDGSRNRFVLFLRELHHQLPEAPPPPDEPPPPEKSLELELELPPLLPKESLPLELDELSD
jgi:hypothetical protein